MIDKKKLEPLTTREMLEEMRDILAEIRSERRGIIFRANHVSNQYPIGGILPRDSAELVQTLDGWIAQCPEGVYPDLSPHML